MDQIKNKIEDIAKESYIQGGSDFSYTLCETFKEINNRYGDVPIPVTDIIRLIKGSEEIFIETINEGIEDK